MSKRPSTGKPAKRPMKKSKSSLAVKKTLKAAREELKNFDTATTGTVVAAQTTATATQLFFPIEGSSPTTHVGRRVTGRSLHYRFVGSMAATSVGSSPIRLMIVYDKQPNTATPATTQVVTIDTISSPMQLFNSRRFKILVNEQIESVGTAGPQCWFKEGFRSLDLETEFNETNGGTIADIQTGSYIAFVWQNGGIITANPTSALYVRIRFVDA